jgi:hypothetical protein
VDREQQAAAADIAVTSRPADFASRIENEEQ